MLPDEEFFGPAGVGQVQLEEKRSLFIGHIWPTASETEAQAQLAATRTRYRDATHNVYAYRIHNGIERCSDDGEPQGTSGAPTLHVLQSENITNVCCVITRYYGGILLGAGGLVRAYSKTAKMALDAAGVSCMRQWSLMLLSCPYSLFDRVKVHIAECAGHIEHTEFGADIVLELYVPVPLTKQLQKKIADCSAGTLNAVLIDIVYRAMRIHES